MATPHHAASTALFSVHSTVTIAAPARAVHAILVDPATYPAWNTFCPRMTMKRGETKLVVGAELTEHINMRGHGKFPASTQGMRVIEAGERDESRGFRLIFANTSWPNWMLWSERVQDCLEAETAEGGCVYETWDTFGGLLAWIVKFLMGGILVERFGDWAEDLKGYAEARQGERGGELREMR